jgi:ABC-type lipoprotein release transport system permease subunit
MYKLFLTLRYLTRKKIVIFPILVVWLCLMMMIIVTSIMGGFVDHVKQSNRDLLGDIVISNDMPSGWAHYDQLQAELAQQVPEIVASTPVVHSFGLIAAHTAARGVEVIGIDPVGRSKVSRFRETLYHQYIAPHDAADDLAPTLPATGAKLAKVAGDRAMAAENVEVTARATYDKIDSEPVAPRPNYYWLTGLVVVAALLFLALRRRRTISSWGWAGAVVIVGGGIIALGTCWPLIFPATLELARDGLERARLATFRAETTAEFAAFLPPEKNFSMRSELLEAFLPKEPSFNVPKEALQYPASGPANDAEKNGCIIGSEILFRRDQRGHLMRSPGGDYLPVRLTVVPIPDSGAVHVQSADTRVFTIVDDSYSGVADVDSDYVYAPFETIQAMAGMRIDDPEIKPGSPDWKEPRCSEVLIKLKDGITQEQMYVIADRIGKLTEAFQAKHPDTNEFPLEVQTWDQKQAKYLNAVENEKVMQQFILGLMSCVVLVVVFLIFYMIVRDKTRDIGIIKAVGGSEEGVAIIFLAYGLFIGIVGGILGMISGVEFVLHTNEIHEFIYRMTGRVIWDRSVYMFDEIPHTVNPHEVAWYFVAALIAGVIGALIPAIVAGSEDPVKAVRYE